MMPASSYFMGSVLLLVALVIVFVGRWISRYSVMAKYLIRGRFDPDDVRYGSSARIRKVLDALENDKSGNCVVYSGFSPFVGSGYDLGGWSFVINVHNGKTDQLTKCTTPPCAFQTGELYDYVEKAVDGLSLKGCAIQDKLYVNGKDIRDDKRFLPDIIGKPLSQVDDSVMEYLKERMNVKARHYMCIRVTSWSGELVLSMFVRFIQNGQNLFTEASYFLLTPVSSKYHEVDNIQPHPRIRDVISILAKSVLLTPFAICVSPIRFISIINASFSRRRKQRMTRRMIKDNVSYDYGATTSLRQWASSTEYRRYFQKMDKDMYFKIIERQILDSIIDFLESKNVDVSELRERQAIIMNSGVIVQGGTVSATNLAIGERATAQFTQRARAATAAGGAGTSS
jgi:hypothetical protein